MFSSINNPRFSPVKPCFSCPVVHPQPLLPLGRFFHRRARVREKDCLIPLSHMPQNSTNRRLLPQAAPLTSVDLRRHLPAKQWKSFFLLFNCCFVKNQIHCTKLLNTKCHSINFTLKYGVPILTNCNKGYQTSPNYNHIHRLVKLK